MKNISTAKLSGFAALLSLSIVISSYTIDHHHHTNANTLFAKDTLFEKKHVLKNMERVADWQLAAWKTNGFKHPKVDWTNGAGYAGLIELGKLSSNKAYNEALIAIGNDLKWNTGKRRFMADDYCIAQMYSQLAMETKDKSKIAAFKLQADSIIAQPHTESLEWKGGIANREWAWCDALFMGPPALAYLYSATGEQKYLDIADKLWWKTTDYLYESSEHLYFRDQSYFAKTEKNGAKVFWSRGNGWVLAGLVRVLENMPKDYPDHGRFVKLYKELATRVKNLQQPDGSWHASLLDPASYPIKETSGTGFYCYAMMWGINHGILEKDDFLPAVKKAWTTLNSCVHPDGMLGYVQPIGASPDKVTEDSTEIYGVGGFLLAGSEIYAYAKKHSF